MHSTAVCAVLASVLLVAPAAADDIYQATCLVNTGTIDTVADEAKGRTDLVQRVRSNGIASPTYLATNWYHLPALEQF